MSEEQLKAFLKKLDCDKDFREKIRSAADTDEIAQIAQQHGFAIDKKDLLSLSDASGTENISEAELEEMAAGCFTISAVYNFFMSQGQFYKTCHQPPGGHS
jgi:predicted ribosomally synthesized peptide with nif11-like leader